TLEQKQAEALSALNSATESATAAAEDLVAAYTWAASCNLLIETPPAYAICEVPALAAVAKAHDSCSYYRDKMNEASQVYKSLGDAIDKLHKLIDDCKVADADNNDDQVTATVAEGQTAFNDSDALEIPDVSGQSLSDAKTAVAEAADATQQAQEAV